MANEAPKSHIDSLLDSMAAAQPDVVVPTTSAEPSPDVVVPTTTTEPPPEPTPDAVQPTEVVTAPPKDRSGGDLQGALHEERARRKELQERLSALEARWADTVEKLTPKAPAPTDAPPDKDADPLGHLEWQNRKLTEKVASVDEQLRTRGQRDEQLQQIQGLQARVAADEQAFAKSNPGYVEAASWVISRRASELEAMGLTPPEIQGVISQEALVMAGRAYQAGSTPAALAFNMAQKLGWKPKAAGEQPRDEHGRFVEQPTSLAGAGAAPVQAGVGLSDDLTKLSNADFDTLFKRMAGG